MKRHLFYSFLAIFIATSVITLLGVIGVLRIADGYLTGLVTAFLIELAGAVIAIFRRADFFVDDNQFRTLKWNRPADVVVMVVQEGDKHPALQLDQPVPTDRHHLPVKARGLDVIHFLQLAYDDYIAARTLFLNNMLPQGCALAATCVEKYLKAIIAIRGNRCRGHLSSSLFKSIENYQPELWKGMNSDFLEFLAKAYELRYLDDKEPGFGIVISKYRALAELDRIVALIDRGFNLQSGGKAIPTKYRTEVLTKSEPLYRENAVLLEASKEEFFRKDNHVFELLVTPDGIILFITYQTKGVRNEGSFLKQPEMSVSTNRFQGKLSFG